MTMAQASERTGWGRLREERRRWLAQLAALRRETRDAI